MEAEMEAERIHGSRIKKALDFFDGLAKANKADSVLDPVVVPLELLEGEEIEGVPRNLFTQEEFDSLDVYTQEGVHTNDPQSAGRIKGMTNSLVNRFDWMTEDYRMEDTSEYFFEGIKYANKQPDFLDTVPDDDGNIEDLINKYGPLLGVPRVEKALLEYLEDVDYYNREYESYYYPSRSGYFQIPISRDFYIGDVLDIDDLDEAYPDEIAAALAKAEDMRPGIDEIGLTVEQLLDVKAGSDFQADLEPTESVSYTPKWEAIVDGIEEELIDELDDQPIPTTDTRSYEERKIYTFNDGAYWVELTTLDLPEEGSKLGHCIGDLEHGHPQKVAAGTHRVFSLRTSSGRPKLTIEIGPMGHVKDLRGKGNRLAGWSGSVGEGRVKWMEVQKVGKLLEILNVPWPDTLDMRKTLEAVKEAVGGPVFTQNPAWHCSFCKESR
jgi:hypothetical protein